LENSEQFEYRPDARVDEALAGLRDQIIAAPDQKLLDLISNGWETFYSEMFGNRLIDAFDSLETADRHHSDAVEWHWESRLALLNGGRPPGDYFAYFPTWARGNMKTTIARAMLRTDALMSFAFGQGGYALIPGGTKAKIKGTSLSVEKQLHDPKILKWCPALSRGEKNIYGHSRGWTSAFIATQANYVFHFIGLDEGVAGANVDDIRPTFIIPDDIDSREDSPVIAETRFKVFTTEVLPTRQGNTLIYWAQNLISRYSVRYRIEKQQVKVLVDRKPTDPIPAVRGLVTEQRTIDGIIKDVVVAGNPTWRGWTLQRVQDEINTYGLPAFEAECQHRVERSNEGLLLYNWQDAVHVISESEFESKFGRQKRLKNGRMAMPERWVKDWVNDWARTKTKFHANIAFFRTVSPQSSPLPGFTFIMHPMSFVANSQPEDVAERLLGCLEDGPRVLKVDDGYRTGYVPVTEKVAQKTWPDLRRDELVRADALSHAHTQLARIEFERDALAAVFPQYTEGTLKTHNVLGGVNSHERDDIRRIYGTVYGLGCRGVNPKKFGGIEQINRDLAVDWNTPHPFRPDQNGYSRTFLVVPDDLLAAPHDAEGVLVHPPKAFTDSISPEALHDDDLFRYQMVNWRTRPAALTATGETIDDPEKLNDDFGNGWQMLTVAGALQNAKLSPQEEFEMLVPNEMCHNPNIPMTFARQHQMEAARYAAQLQIEDKYGAEELQDEFAGEEDDEYY
jgi:hypothetical protein